MSEREFEREFLQFHNRGPAEAKAHCCKVEVLDRGTRRSLWSREQSGQSEIA